MVYIYLLEFRLISRSSYVSSLRRWQLNTVLNSKDRDESSIPHIGRLYRLHSSREAQSRFRRPGRTRTRDTGRTCVCCIRRLLAASMLPVLLPELLPSSSCVRPVLLSCFSCFSCFSLCSALQSQRYSHFNFLAIYRKIEIRALFIRKGTRFCVLGPLCVLGPR